MTLRSNNAGLAIVGLIAVTAIIAVACINSANPSQSLVFTGILGFAATSIAGIIALLKGNNEK